MVPDKIYVREYPDGINQFWDRKKRDEVVAAIHHEYIRKDALMKWANDMINDDKNRGIKGGFYKLKDKLNEI